MKGKLKLANNKKTWLLVREDGKEMQVAARVLTRGLFPLDPKRHDGLEVEYDLDKGQPARIREVGAEWQPQTKPGGGGAPQSAARKGPLPRSEIWADRPSPPGDFHNPYNFIPAPPRPVEHPELGDHPPAGHDRYRADLWSGRISVKLTTETPLLILDAANVSVLDGPDEHKVFPVRVDAAGKPYLPPTSIKGMLRSAFEAVTNSRMGVFEGHGDRLAYRMAAKVGPVPARVESRDGRLELRIMEGGAIGFPAKLRRYRCGGTLPKDKGESTDALPYRGGGLPQHADAVWVQTKDGIVSAIQISTPEEPPPAGWRPGWVCITGANINGKLYERVFIKGPNDEFIPITDRHRELWRELVQNYKDTHVRDLDQRKKRGRQPLDYLGDKPGRTGWSRHIYEDHSETLSEGTLCYVEFMLNSTTEIAALIPVTISRRLYTVSPASLLPDSLKPPQGYAQLSPAERVFGWVNQNGHGAYRGNLRIGPVRCTSSDPIVAFDHPGLPLAILGQPKPQQARFYAAGSKYGEAQQSDISKERAGYSSNKGLRGRKVYPHHAGLPEGHWDDPMRDRTQQDANGHFQEYRRPHGAVSERGLARLNRDRTAFELETGDDGEQRDDQNRSIIGWVRPQTQFEFEIDVTNLSGFELGALLWLLTLPEGHFHRLGGGKPLGFGSVRLDVDPGRSDLRRGNEWRDFYSTMDDTSRPDDAAARECVATFERVMGETFGDGEIDRVAFIAAFRRCALGFADGKPVHYPRALQRVQSRGANGIPPHPDGKAFEWFVANERTGQAGGPKLALPDITNDQGLPILEAR
jgi:CRISPR-associated protein (TIGR03986 family)